MTPTINITFRSFFLLFCLFYLNQAFATRYDVAQINEPVVNAINNVGTIVGTNFDGKPYVRLRNQSDMTYPDEADIALQDRVYNKLLPADFPYSEIHVLDINNEIDGGGGTIVGWFIDENGLSQSVLWYLEENQRQEYEYLPLILPPHKLSPFYCSGDPEVDFPQTECMFSKDSDLIYRATLCASFNENWQTPNNIFVDKTFKYDEGESPNCSSANTIPICEFKAEKILKKEPKVIQGEDGPTEVPDFEYILNKDYNSQTCILKEHAEFVVQAIQCDNSNFEAAGDALVINCDPSSRAIGINNQSLVMGISDKPEGGERPIIWAKSENKSDEGKPIYNSADLGKTRINTPSNATGTNVESEISDNIDTFYYNGYPTALDKVSNAVAGMLYINPDSPPSPMYWGSVSADEVISPGSLLPPNAATTIRTTCQQRKVSNKVFSTPVIPTSVASGIIVGWYEDLVDASPKSIMWIPCPETDENNKPIVELKAGHLPSLNENETINTGKALGISIPGEIIGTTEVNVINENGDTVSANHAFYRTLTCGIQDINRLLSAPVEDKNLVFESTYFIANGAPPTPLLALGKTVDSGNINPYVLTPAKVFADLEVSIKSDNRKLTVGDEHSITITIKNNGAVDNDTVSNFATCIFFRLTTTIYAQVTYEDKIKQAQLEGLTITEAFKKELENYPKIEDELVGGLTFDSYENSNENVICSPNRIEIICALERLDARQGVEITIKTTPRELLADRTIRTTASVYSTESETPDSLLNNVAFELIDIEREACFIATAAYGSYLTPEVKVLRDFRDNVLLKSSLGRSAVNFYYDVSPSLANIIANNNVLRTVTRWLLSPIIYAVKYPAIGFAFFMLLFFLLLKNRYRKINII